MDRKWIILGLLAVGMLFLIPKKKTKAKRIKALSGISLNRRKVCRADITKKKIHCRVQNPKEFGAFFMRTSTTPGVKYVMGISHDTEKAVLQSVLFDKHIWDTREAKIWFNRNIQRLMKRDKKTLSLSDSGVGKHDVLRWKIGDKQLEVIKNPTASEIRQISNEFHEKYPRAKESGIRTTYDQYDNKYVWNSESMHADIEPTINMIYNVKTNQSPGISKWLMEDDQVANLRKMRRTFDLGSAKWKKQHDEDYFSPRQQEMFPGMRRELILKAEDNASILTTDPLDVCLERQGWELPKVKIGRAHV